MLIIQGAWFDVYHCVRCHSDLSRCHFHVPPLGKILYTKRLQRPILPDVAADLSLHKYYSVLDSSFATLRFHKCALLYTKFYRICIFMSIFRLVMLKAMLKAHCV